MDIYAVDPGDEISAVVQYSTRSRAPILSLTDTNESIIAFLYTEGRVTEDTLVIEEFESYGMAVGREVFRTVWWSGRFYEVWNGNKIMLPRRTAKLHLTGQTRARDSEVRTAIIDAFGGKIRAIGKKKTPGPLHGVKGHEWAALALALTHAGHHGA